MKKKIAITIDLEVYETIKKTSTIEDRSISSQINKMLKDAIKKNAK